MVNKRYNYYLVDWLRLPESRVAHKKGRFSIEKGLPLSGYHKGPLSLPQAQKAKKYLEQVWQ